MDIDTGLARLIGVLTELADVPVDELYDRLLDRLLTGRVDDDVALLAVRCHRENEA